MKLKSQKRICAGPAVMLLLCLVLLPSPSRSQPAVQVERFKIPVEYYPKPHETQMKALLEGARARQLPDGRVEVEEARWRTFSVTGEGEMTAEAPQCTYNPKPRTISSPGTLRVQTADGKFSIEGVGFIFQQTNSTLLVSNQVHTMLHPELLKQSPGAVAVTNVEAQPAEGIEIFSDEFEYGVKTGLGYYRGHVHVTGTNLNATAGTMSILLPVNERRLKTLTAEQDVVIDYETLHATGERGEYSDDTGLVRMSGQPTWRVGQRAGSGDELILDRTNRLFRANGHGRLTMPAQSMGESGFLSRGGSPSAAAGKAADHIVEVLCADYEIRTNAAVFRDHVRVNDLLGNQPQGQMTCELMTLTFTGTNELQRMVAERRVVIGQQEKQFTAERAEYTGTNGLLDLTGNPTWRDGSRAGSGDLLRVDLAHEEMLAKGNAMMKLPAAELGHSAVGALGRPKAAGPTARTNDFAEIRSREYFVTPDSALFKGGVRIEHPQMQWVCQEITMLSPPELGKDGHVIIAEPEVAFDYVDDQGRKFHGTGDKAVYTHSVATMQTNDVVQLTGTPAMLSSTNFIGRNHLINLDLATHTVTTPGKYKLWGTLPAGSVTRFQLPQPD